MKKIILLILGMQISFTCFASQSKGISLTVKNKESSSCTIKPTVICNEDGTKDYYSSSDKYLADKSLYNNLCTLAVEFAGPSKPKNKLTKELLSKSIFAEKYNSEDIKTVKLLTLLTNIKEAREEDIAIESFDKIKLNLNDNNKNDNDQSHIIHHPVASFTLALTKSDTVTRHSFDFFAEKCCHGNHHHINSIDIRELPILKHPSRILGPWWQWSALAVIGCGGLAAAYFVYHKWVKK